MKLVKKGHFDEFPSDDESASTDTVEVEATNYLSTTAKNLDCLHKFYIIKALFLGTTPHFPSVLQWKDCSA